VRRNRAAVAAGAALAAALAVGAGATAWQARIAARERDKAENRFRQVQQFSRSLLFDVHRALRAVPGATDARRVLLDRAVTFLDGLAADAGHDDAMLLELASGYQQLANVQGNQLSDNVGDTAAAMVSVEKAVALVAAVRARRPDDPDVLIRAVDVTFDLASVRSERGDASAAAARDTYEALVHELERHAAGTPRTLRSVAKGYSDIGTFRVNDGDFDRAEQAYREAVRLFDSLPPDARDVPDLRDHGYALKRLGAVLLRGKKYDDSEAYYRRALALDEQVLARDNRPETRFDITFTLSDLGMVQQRRNAMDDAMTLWRRALDIRRALADADPKNTRAVGGVATLLNRLGNAAFQQRDFSAAEARYREELGLRDRLVAVQGPLPGRVSERSWARLNLAASLLARAAASPRDPGRRSWVEEATRLVAATRREDGKVSVPAGSEPGFQDLYDELTARLRRS
jgi:non-specific serine/threonine protein kinase/serine/threonine-protein kinase